jgi:arylsulfatase A-like enzyme
MNAGFDDFPADYSSAAIDELVGLRRNVMELWEESSNDGITYRIARTYLFERKPRLLWLGLTQSDDWAHADRYDRLLEYLHLADNWLQDLWSGIQADSHYRDTTTLIVTTDHGRGRTPADWAEHDQAIPGSESVWLAIIGPDTPATGDGVPPGIVNQGDVAATIVRLFGLDPDAFSPAARPALPGVIDTAAMSGAR